MKNILPPAIACSGQPRDVELRPLTNWACRNQDPWPSEVARRKGYAVHDEARRLHEDQGRIPTVATPMVRTRPSEVAKQTCRRRLSGFTPDFVSRHLSCAAQAPQRFLGLDHQASPRFSSFPPIALGEG